MNLTFEGTMIRWPYDLRRSWHCFEYPRTQRFSIVGLIRFIFIRFILIGVIEFFAGR